MIEDDLSNRIEVVQGDLDNFSDSDNYDTIVLSNCVLTQDNDVVYNKIRNHLKTNGRLIISRPFGVFGDELSEGVLNYGWDLLPLFSMGIKLSAIDLIGSELDSIPYYWLCVSYDLSEGSVHDIQDNYQFVKQIEYLLSKKEIDALKSVKKMKGDKERIMDENQKRNLVLAKEILKSVDVLNTISQQLDPNLYDEIDFYREKDVDSSITNNSPHPIAENNISAIQSEELRKISMENRLLKTKLDESFSFIEQELREEERIIKQLSEANKKIEKMEVKYRSLASSLPSRMTLLYWDFLKNKKAKKSK
jgi:hypothetical protein